MILQHFRTRLSTAAYVGARQISVGIQANYVRGQALVPAEPPEHCHPYAAFRATRMEHLVLLRNSNSVSKYGQGKAAIIKMFACKKRCVCMRLLDTNVRVSRQCAK